MGPDQLYFIIIFKQLKLAASDLLTFLDLAS